jgi:hypothetical protein
MRRLQHTSQNVTFPNRVNKKKTIHTTVDKCQTQLLLNNTEPNQNTKCSQEPWFKVSGFKIAVFPKGTRTCECEHYMEMEGRHAQ